MTHRYATGLLGLLSAVFLLSLGSSGGPVAGDDADEYQSNDFDARERNQEDSVLQTRPVLLIPGFASTQLNAWKKVSCKNSFQKNLYRDVNIGDRLWIDVARILAQGDCWVQCMKLHMVNQSEVECKLRAGEGTSAIAELDPGIVTGPLSNVWGSMIRDLVDQFGLGPEQLIVAPYDWRLPPSKMQERDNYFYSLMKKIEYSVDMHGNGGGLVVIAHSMGNGVFRYFLEWLKLELGKNHWQKWIDKHISTYFAVGSPLLGSSEALELLASGLTQGLPITQKEIRKLVVTFGAILSFLPIPSTLNSTHDNEPLISVHYEATSDSQKARETKYTAAEIANGQLFRDMAVRDPIFAQLEEVRKRFYEEDDVLDFFVPWERPPIASVYSIYGVNMPTKHTYKYQDTDIDGHWYQVALANEHDRLHACSKTGDATVPYHSLSWAHTWLGEPGTFVNVTQVPQSVYFSAENIKQFKAVRRGESHHAEYSTQSHKQPMCATKKDAVGAVADNAGFLEGLFKSSTLDQITFFERRTEVNGVARSTGVWEVDNAGHREILANPAFLRELRAEIRQVFKGKIISDKTSRPPVIDSDCYWNYRQAKCEFPEFCEYRYSFGDVILDQSCRLRQQPMRQRPKRVRPPLVDKDELKPDEQSDESVELATGPTTMGPYVEAARPYCSAPCSPSYSSHTKSLDAKVLKSCGGNCT